MNGPSPFVKDNWDWPFIMYAGTVWLKRTEEEVWKLTPRKLQALMRVHYDVMKKQNGVASKDTKQEYDFIDNIPGW